MADTSEPAIPEMFAHPRLFAVREQRDRARMFLQLGRDTQPGLVQFRLFVAAVYFARAMVELMREAASQEELTENREQLETRLLQLLPRYSLVERVRIHDFHRFGVLPRPGFFMGGPIRVKAQEPNTGIQVEFTRSGPLTSETGRAHVVWNRALQMNHDRVFDDDAGEWLSLDQVLEQFLSGADGAVSAFENLAKPPDAA